MKPIKSAKIIEQTAKELNLDPSIVSDVVHAYYTQVRAQLSKPTCTAVYLTKLGSFVLMRKQVIGKIDKYTNIINVLDNDPSMSKFARKMKKQEDLDIYKKMLLELDDDRSKKIAKKIERYKDVN